MKVWVVERGEYSDRGIVAVFSTEAQAHAFADPYGDSVSEFTLDDATMPPPGMKPYVVSMDYDTGEASVHQKHHEPDDGPPRAGYRTWHGAKSATGPTHMTVECWARDEVHAVKIASEKRAEMRALGVIGQATFRCHTAKWGHLFHDMIKPGQTTAKCPEHGTEGELWA